MTDKMTVDTHVHTCFSCDSKESMEAYCEKALRDGIDCICFTDHVDNNINDDGCDYYNQEGFFECFNKTQDKYGDRIKLLSGIEFAEPHEYPKELDRLKKFPYDLILGSIHFWYMDLFASQVVKSQLSIEDSYKYYWDEVYRAVSAGGFDSLAHMDFPKRYYGQLLYNDSDIADIFTQMIKNDITLEINTSSLRKGLDETMPGDGIVDIYRKQGGRYVTIGSDAHQSDDLIAGRDKALETASGLDEVIYVCRERIKIN